MNIEAIDDVILSLEDIVSECEEKGDPLGYFAVLYQKVTIAVKVGVAAGFFDDGPRMEQLDVVFARRYIEAYFAFRQQNMVTQSWLKAFSVSGSYWPIVLQHLLMGMNAHINLDLGIAAAEVSKGKRMADLEKDFNRINEILSSLVHEVEGNLSLVWPALKFILKHTGKVDDYLVDFSMKLARDGAWKFANSIAGLSGTELEQAIIQRDLKVSIKTAVILNTGIVASVVLKLIRVTEWGSVKSKIRKMR
jgi:hypothetical protein